MTGERDQEATSDSSVATVDGLLRRATERLAAAWVPSPRVDAEILLAHVVGVSRGELSRAVLLRTPLARLRRANLGAEQEMPGAAQREVLAEFAEAVARRVEREPLQHITGRAPFRNLELAVGPGVFVPRPETEEVAQAAIDEARAVVAERGSAIVVDLCAGSGAIALALATEVPGTRVIAVELDERAHAWAARNVASTGVAGATPVELHRGDARRALSGVPETGGFDGICDVVVSNPPYVPPGAVPHDPEVADHDPPVALYGLGPDGLEVPRGITAAAARLLRPGGLYVMEHAEVQAAAARDMVEASGFFERALTRDDLTGRPRMAVARRNSEVEPA